MNAPETESATGQPETRHPERFTGHTVQIRLFEGPLDLLLYLIKAHKYDIFDIPIREITGQFVEYISLMDTIQAEYAGDFLVTAATLMQIKARMLLPQQESVNEEALDQDDEDPRALLVQRLLDYQSFQEAAEELKTRHDEASQLFGRQALLKTTNGEEELTLGEVSPFDLLTALRRVLKRLEEKPVALVRREPFSLPERLKALYGRLKSGPDGWTFGLLCEDCESRLEVVITFLAVLEMIKQGRVRIRQLTLFDEIWVEVS